MGAFRIYILQHRLPHKFKRLKSMKSKVKNTRYRLTRYHSELLRMFQNNVMISRIAKKMKCSETNIYKHSYQLINNGYMTKDHRTFYLTPKGIEEVKNFLMVSHKVKFNKDVLKADTNRLHNLQFTCNILKKPRGWGSLRQKILRSHKIEYSVARLRGNIEIFHYDNVEVRTTPNYVLIILPNLFYETPEQCKSHAIGVLRNIMSQIEHLFKISLEKPRKVSIEVSKQHNALIYNEIAKQFLEKGMEFRIFDEYGKLIALVDDSLGMKELEFIHPIDSEEHSTKMQQEISNIITGKNKQWRSQVMERLDELEGFKKRKDAGSGDLYG